MSDDSHLHTVLVLTDRPEAYHADMRRFGLRPLFASTVAGLFNHLLDNPTSGFVLEVGKVLRTPGAERDRLFRIAGSFPLLRASLDADAGKLQYLDDPECFLSNTTTFNPRKLRCHLRVPVRLNVELAVEDDPRLGKPCKANLLDISLGGGFAYSLETFPEEQFLHLRILEISDPAPIFANIRWRKPWGQPNALPGLGLLFVDIAAGQLEELRARYIEPPREYPLVSVEEDCQP